MIEYLKLHYRYLMQNRVIVVLMLFFSIYGISILSASGLFEGASVMQLYRDEYQFEYLTEAISILKLISVSLSLFFVILMQMDSHRNIAKYIVDRPIKKLSFVVSTLTFTVLSGILTSTLLCLYMAVYTRFFTPYIIEIDWYVTVWTLVSTQIITYIVLGTLLYIIVPTVFIILIPLLIYWYMEANAAQEMIHNKLLVQLYRFIPNPVWIQDKIVQIGNTLDYWLFILLATLIIISLYQKRDIH